MKIHSLLLLLALCLLPETAQAQSSVRICNSATPQDCAGVTGGALDVNATVSASIGGFPGDAQSTGSPISVTTGGVTGTLPAGEVVLATNDGATNTAYCKLGASATVNDAPVYPHSSVSFTVGSATQLTCITSTSTTTVKMSGGSGLPTGWGGGSSSGGGGGAVTIADSADVTEGGVADAASSAGGTGTLSAKQRLMTTQLGAINTTLGTPMQATGGTVTANAGTNLNTSALNLEATQQSVLAAINSPIPAGTAVIGSVLPLVTNAVWGTTSAMTGTTSTSLIAGTSSKVTYVTSLSCVNSHATVGTFVTIQDGSGGTALGTVAAAAVFGGTVLQAGGVPLFPPTTSGNGVFVADVTTGANVICTAAGFHS